MTSLLAAQMFPLPPQHNPAWKLASQSPRLHHARLLRTHAALADLLNDERAVFLGDRWQFELGHPFGEAVQASYELISALAPAFELDSTANDFSGENGGGQARIDIATVFCTEHHIVCTVFTVIALVL